MKRPSSILPLFLGLASFVASPRAFAEPENLEGTLYELLPGSELRIDCFVCELARDHFDLVGRFRLVPLNAVGKVVTTYALEDIDLRDAEGVGFAALSGGGQLSVQVGGPQSLTLNLSLSGGEVTELAGGVDAPLVAFPEIDLDVTRKGDPIGVSIRTVRLIARPFPAGKPVRYRLLPESFFVDHCNFCKRQLRPFAIGGSFLLTPVVEVGPFARYRIDDVIIDAVEEPKETVALRGFGEYTRVEEFAMHHSMVLDLRVPPAGIETPSFVIQSGAVLREAPFPSIQLDLTQTNPASDDHIIKLHIVAEPGDSPAFRRGDANADGLVDISDPVRLLDWLFQGEAPPTCLETAEVNLDGSQDISDAVYLLEYMFLGGSAPPSPGPEVCGADHQSKFGCEVYEACPARL